MRWCGIDPGASRNAAGIAVVGKDRRGNYGPVYLKEIKPPPGCPIDLRNVLVSYAKEVRALGCSSWATDGFAAHDVLHAGKDADIGTVQATTKLQEQWRHLLAVCARGRHALGTSRYVSDDMLDELVSQLATVEEAFINGLRTIRIPEVGTSHGDLASAYARAMWHARAGDDLGARESRVRLHGASEYASEVAKIDW